jgi:hypothetical protein
VRSARSAALRVAIKRRLRLAGFEPSWNAGTRDLRDMLVEARTRAGTTHMTREGSAETPGKPGTEARHMEAA